MKLTRKFTLALVAGVLVVQVGFGALRVERERELFHTDIRLDERVVGRALAVAAAREVETSGVDRAKRLVQDAAFGAAHVQIRWVELEEDVEEAHRPQLSLAELAPVTRGEEVVTQTTDELVTVYSYTPVRLSDGSYAAIEVADTLEDEREYVRQSVRNAVLSTAALVVLCGLVGWALGHLLIGRPVRLLVGRARAIGEGELDGRVELPQRDELGELADEMNAMADALSRTRARLDKEGRARIAVLEQLKHADRLRTVGTLASGIAHELGTPLNVIEGHAQLILEDEVAGEEAQENATVIKRQSKRMTGIIRQLLDFARREQGKTGDADVVAAASQMVDMIGPFAKKRGVRVVLDCPPALPKAAIPTDELVQVLSNLVINGIQAMNEGGELQLEVARARASRSWTDEPERDMIRFVVTDQGCGMDDATVERVFEPFYTTKDVGEGTGLGLSVAYGIVDERSGWIDVESEPGAGSTFSIFIPVATAA